MQPVLIVGGIRAGLAVPERLKGRRSRLCSWAASIINSIGRRSIRARLLERDCALSPPHIAWTMRWSFTNGW